MKEKKDGAELAPQVIQMPNKFNELLKAAAAGQHVTKYELINKLLVIGAREWSKNKKREFAIDTKDPELRISIEMANIPDIKKTIKA